MRELNLDTQELAERALARDPRNMMAHSILARQYTMLGRDRPADESWGRVVSDGGVVVWTATLYDVDDKSYFFMSFGRDAVRIYRMGQFTGPIDRRLRYAKFPEPAETAFYEAAAGCPDPSIAPAATIRWSNVKELRSGNWVLWFKLATPVTMVSDRGNRKTLREIKVNLHGETGEVTMLAERNPGYDPGREDEVKPSGTCAVSASGRGITTAACATCSAICGAPGHIKGLGRKRGRMVKRITKIEKRIEL